MDTQWNAHNGDREASEMTQFDYEAMSSSVARPLAINRHVPVSRQAAIGAIIDTARK